ncbi:hypothetical protein [Pseudomonas orientalis]|uniref:hypothetical protein n=1 Tax=Pseudomonas orientalis TaxID=76758 RepID=UPI0030DC917A
MSIPARRSNIDANSAGSKDLSFGNTLPKTGESFFSQITGISALRDDGSIITAGICYFENLPYIAVFIHNADGELDPEHSPMFIPTTGFARLFNLIIQPDGKPLLLFSLGDAAIAMVARFNKDGTLDTEFGVEGTSSLNIRIHAGLLPRSGLAVRHDGAILVAHTSTQESYIHELNSNGTATNFGKPGPVKLDGTAATSLIISSTGFVVGGDRAGQAMLLGYDASGEPDVEFGERGEKTLGQNLTVSALALGPQGSIGVVGASRFPPDEQNFITKLQPNGSFSQEFNNGSPKVTDDNNTGAYTSLIFQDDGKMVPLARDYARGSYVNLVRHTLGGYWDTLFGIGGVAEAYRVPQGRPLTAFVDKLEWVSGHGKLQISGDVSGGSFIGRVLSV